MPVWPSSSSIRSSVRWARISAEVKATSNLSPLRLELAAGLARFRDALFGQVDIAPAGEQVFLVPFAFAVTHEDEKTVGHYLLVPVAARILRAMRVALIKQTATTRYKPAVSAKLRACPGGTP